MIIRPGPSSKRLTKQDFPVPVRDFPGPGPEKSPARAGEIPSPGRGNSLREFNAGLGSTGGLGDPMCTRIALRQYNPITHWVTGGAEIACGARSGGALPPPDPPQPTSCRLCSCAARASRPLGRSDDTPAVCRWYCSLKMRCGPGQVAVRKLGLPPHKLSGGGE